MYVSTNMSHACSLTSILFRPPYFSLTSPLGNSPHALPSLLSHRLADVTASHITSTAKSRCSHLSLSTRRINDFIVSWRRMLCDTKSFKCLNSNAYWNSTKETGIPCRNPGAGEPEWPTAHWQREVLTWSSERDAVLWPRCGHGIPFLGMPCCKTVIFFL